MIPRLVGLKEFFRWEKISRRAHDSFSHATCFVINKHLENNSQPLFDAYFIDPLFTFGLSFSLSCSNKDTSTNTTSRKLVARGAAHSTSASCWARTAARRAMKFHRIVIENNYKCKENISPWFALFFHVILLSKSIHSLFIHRDFLLQTLAVAVKSRFPL